ncbi:uncharacterized protein LOC115731550 [Rhodamnia argentea]|uniref:Uncharacterized protein LOC115731550 n=1 Tax=Rhodamnia argentea TaxID=178133 RepID=A0A8B8N6L8_9MYRT|nr:uncharacterized protein LOC115731550 [Rhodamnia argentea]
MDGNENPPPPPPSLLHAIASFSVAALAHLSSLSAHPLFSTAFAFYALVLLYFPRIFIRVLLSPVLAITAVSLLALLRLGAAQRARERDDSSSAAAAPAEGSRVAAGGESGRDSSRADGGQSSEVGFPPSTRYECRFVEWDVKAPLEVIYEEYEGEGDEEEDDDSGFSLGGLERYPSLSMCYPDSDSESSSPGGDFGFNFGSDSPEEGAFRWDTEDGGEGLIEIALNLLGGEEDNLIEIDISPARKYGSEG